MCLFTIWHRPGDVKVGILLVSTELAKPMGIYLSICLSAVGLSSRAVIPPLTASRSAADPTALPWV